jgi:hypothetical protein
MQNARKLKLPVPLKRDEGFWLALSYQYLVLEKILNECGLRDVISTSSDIWYFVSITQVLVQKISADLNTIQKNTKFRISSAHRTSF